jgi:hypothetical protein
MFILIECFLHMLTVDGREFNQIVAIQIVATTPQGTDRTDFVVRPK